MCGKNGGSNICGTFDDREACLSNSLEQRGVAGHSLRTIRALVRKVSARCMNGRGPVDLSHEQLLSTFLLRVSHGVRSER